MTIDDLPAPGERRTTIIVWEIDDARKQGDPRYWWLDDEVERLQKLSPEVPDLRGRPKGQSLGSLRARADGDEVELLHPAVDGLGEGAPIRIPLTQWRDADPERTYLIVAHIRRPTPDEQDAINRRRPRWPEWVESLRREWLAADTADGKEQAAQARQRLEEALTELGYRKAADLSPFSPEKAVELRPAVFVQDERPS